MGQGQTYPSVNFLLYSFFVGNAEIHTPAHGQTGEDTFRCKECHGWDYIGKDGRYSKGSHYTGIDGIYDARTKTPKELFDILTDTASGHGIKGLSASHENIWALVKFLQEGLIDPDMVFNADWTVKGDPAKGKAQQMTPSAGHRHSGVSYGVRSLR